MFCRLLADKFGGEAWQGVGEAEQEVTEGASARPRCLLPGDPALHEYKNVHKKMVL